MEHRDSLVTIRKPLYDAKLASCLSTRTPASNPLKKRNQRTKRSLKAQ